VYLECFSSRFHETLSYGLTPLAPQFIVEVTQKVTTHFTKLAPYLVMVQVHLYAINFGITYAMVVRGSSATEGAKSIGKE
jgi:hypothetical protein